MVSEDNKDYLEEGQTPPDNAQYWVAPFIQEIFDDLIKKYLGDIADLIKKSSCMELA